MKHRMLTRKLAFIFIAIFVMMALPLLMATHTGSGIAGISAGLAAPLDNPYHLLLFLAIGLWAGYLGREAVIVIPLSFVLMMLSASAMETNGETFSAARSLSLGGILLFAILVGMIRSRVQLVSTVVVASLGFHLGGGYLNQLPDYANPLYFVVGNGLSVMCALGIVVSLALILFREMAFYVATHDQPGSPVSTPH